MKRFAMEILDKLITRLKLKESFRFQPIQTHLR